MLSMVLMSHTELSFCLYDITSGTSVFCSAEIVLPLRDIFWNVLSCIRIENTLLCGLDWVTIGRNSNLISVPR